MQGVSISLVKLREIPAVRRQFIDAIHGSFRYISPAYSDKILQHNSLLRLYGSHFRPDRSIAVARNGGRVIGYAIGGITGGLANLFWLYVDPSYRGQQIGLKLLQFFCDECQNKGATKIALSTYDHEEFYKQFGFITLDEQELHGVPMKIMQLELIS